MNKRNEIILRWLEERRPDLVSCIKNELEKSKETDNTISLMLSIGFESGRLFQYENPLVELNNRGVYSEEQKSMLEEGTFELRYCPDPKDGKVMVGINSKRHYTKTLAFAAQLLAELKRRLPFKYQITNEPKIEILSGERVKGMLSIEMHVSYSISDEEAKGELDAAGFWSNFEQIK